MSGPSARSSRENSTFCWSWCRVRPGARAAGAVERAERGVHGRGAADSGRLPGYTAATSVTSGIAYRSPGPATSSGAVPHRPRLGRETLRSPPRGQPGGGRRADGDRAASQAREHPPGNSGEHPTGTTTGRCCFARRAEDRAERLEQLLVEHGQLVPDGLPDHRCRAGPGAVAPRERPSPRSAVGRLGGHGEVAKGRQQEPAAAIVTASMRPSRTAMLASTCALRRASRPRRRRPPPRSRCRARWRASSPA